MKRRLYGVDFRLWAVSWAVYAWHRGVLRVYDDLMIRWWPYDRWPGEWKDLLPRRIK